MEERIIVTLTTYSKRIGNIPTILETIFKQTVPPDFVVLNLAYDEVIPDDVKKYINTHPIEVNRVPDTKVYKKLIPTLKKYPHDAIISIDDDWLYPKEMIEDFVHIHKRYPNYPISGNHAVAFGFQCHCGCASLTKAEYFEGCLEMIDEEVIKHCKCDDIVYTYFANKSGHPYIRTKGLYFSNMIPYNGGDGYSLSLVDELRVISESFEYLSLRFGQMKELVHPYIKDAYFADFLGDLCKLSYEKQLRRESEKTLKSSLSFRLGNILLSPFRIIRYNLFSKKE